MNQQGVPSRNGFLFCTGIFCLVFFFALFAGGAAQGQAADRRDPTLELMKWADHDVVKDELLVQFSSQAAAPARAALHKRTGAKRIQGLGQGLDRIRFKGRTLEEVLHLYSTDPAVEFAEPNHIYRLNHTPNDGMWSQQWGPEKINCPKAWDKHQGSSASVVAIIDTGVDMDHPDLEDRYAWGYDYHAGDSTPNDTAGHGTHVAGIACAVPDNSLGVAGVAYHCRFAGYRAGSFYLTDSAIVNSINHATTQGALVISMSFGDTHKSASVKNALFNAYSAGVVCVAAAGNSGNTQVHYPAGYGPVLSVASSSPHDKRSGFSTHGSWVDVAAPGESILSTWNNGGYSSQDGTSMACPLVSGMAVLLYDLLGGVRNQANAILVRKAIQNSAVEVGAWVKHGRVDLRAAMDLIAPPLPPPEIDEVAPALVEAFPGETITLTGRHFSQAERVNWGSTILEAPHGFTVVSDTELTFPSPAAEMLGLATVTVSGSEGTSNVGYYTYMETAPPKLAAPATLEGEVDFTWTFGGGSEDPAFLIVSLDKATFLYSGSHFLLNFGILHTKVLDLTGLGSYTVNIPAGYGGISFFTQVVTVDDQTGAIAGTSNILETRITY